MASPDLTEIAATLSRLAGPEMRPKELMRAVRDAHPQASKKDVVRAAFLAVITHSGDDAERSRRLHGFALGERSGVGADAPAVPRPKRRRKDR